MTEYDAKLLDVLVVRVLLFSCGCWLSGGFIFGAKALGKSMNTRKA